MSLSTLPFDVLDMIADYLDDPKSLASAAATSKSNYEALMPVLCGVILTVVNGSQDSMQRNEQLCNLFLRRPDLLGYVKVVHICGSTSRSEAIKQGLDLFASIVEGATKINKVTIKNFKDSLEEGDRLYKALQSCTNLRTINIVTDSKMLDMQLLAKFQVPLSNIRLKGGHCNGDHKSYDLWRNLAPYQESLRLLDMQGIHYPIEKAGPTVWAELKTLSLHGCKLLKNTVAECFPNIEVLNLLKVTHEDGQKDAEITTPMAFVKLQQLEADVHSLKSFLTNIFAPSMFSVTLSNSLSDKLLEDKVVDVLDGFLTRVAVPILELQIETPFSNLLYELSTKSERTDVVILRVALRLPQVRSSSDVGLLVDLVDHFIEVVLAYFPSIKYLQLSIQSDKGTRGPHPFSFYPDFYELGDLVNVLQSRDNLTRFSVAWKQAQWSARYHAIDEIVEGVRRSRRWAKDYERTQDLMNRLYGAARDGVEMIHKALQPHHDVMTSSEYKELYEL